MELMLVLWYDPNLYAEAQGEAWTDSVLSAPAETHGTQCSTVLHPLQMLCLCKLSLTIPPQYTAAAKQSALDNTSRAISSLFNVMKQDTKLQSILSTPTLQESDKSAIIGELEKHTGGADKSGTVKNFLSTLAQNNRLGILEGVCEKFTQLISAGKGEIELIITSAAVCLPRCVSARPALSLGAHFYHASHIFSVYTGCTY